MGGIRNTEALRALGICRVVEELVLDQAELPDGPGGFPLENGFALIILDERGVIARHLETNVAAQVKRGGKNAQGEPAEAFEDWKRVLTLSHLQQLVCRNELSFEEEKQLTQLHAEAKRFAQLAFRRGYNSYSGIRETGEDPAVPDGL